MRGVSKPRHRSALLAESGAGVGRIPARPVKGWVLVLVIASSRSEPLRQLAFGA
jgi:hypothetical protein